VLRLKKRQQFPHLSWVSPPIPLHAATRQHLFIHQLQDPSGTFGNTTEFTNPPIDNLLWPIHTFYTNNPDGILSTLQPQPILVTYAPASPILHFIHLPHAHFLFTAPNQGRTPSQMPNCSSSSHGKTSNSESAPLDSFPPNFLLKLESSLVINTK